MGKKGHYPVQTNLDVKLEQTLPGGGSAEFHAIQLDKGLSVLNRRFYRQNKVYTCKVKSHGMADQMLHVYRLRNTWMLQNSYKLAKEVYDKTFKDAKDHISKSQIARWRDFRIDVRPHSETSIAQWVSMRYDTGSNQMISNSFTPDEYEISTIYNSAGGAETFGFDAANKNILSEYDRTGNVSLDPESTETTVAYENFFSDLDDDEVETLATQGNAPPYDRDSSAPLDILEYVGTIVVNNSNGVMKTSTGFFEAPLGVIFIDSNQQSSGAQDQIRGLIHIEVKEGNYKGVHAEDFV